MNAAQVERITHMRRMGQSYGSIADTMGISLNTVKSFCQRNRLGGKKTADPASDTVPCAYCGTPVLQTAHRKQKRYCSDACRMKWWDAHRHLIRPESKAVFRCQCCGSEFTDYVSAARKYCSHGCYVKARFGGVSDE